MVDKMISKPAHIQIDCYDPNYERILTLRVVKFESDFNSFPVGSKERNQACRYLYKARKQLEQFHKWNDAPDHMREK